MDNYQLREKTHLFFRQNSKQFVIVLVINYVLVIGLDILERILLMMRYGLSISLSNFINYSQLVSVVDTQFDFVSVLVQLIVGIGLSVFTAGISIAVLKGIRRGYFEAKDVFEVFRMKWGRLALIIILTQLIISILSIAIVPGIIATYSLAMNYFMFSDHPENSVPDSMKMSHQFMRGKRMKLFLAELYYLAWIVAALLVSVVLTYVGLVIGIISFVLVSFISAFVGVLVIILHAQFYTENI